MRKHDILWVDFIRVIATFSVVLLHTAAPLLYEYNKLPITDWWAANIYDSMVRMCVPLFFILTGYLLLEKKETISVFFIKRSSKVIIPLIFWSIFYLLWRQHYQVGFSLSFYSFYSLFLTPAYYHLWYLYAIIGLYLYVPILRVLVQNSPKELLFYFVALWFIAVSIIPFFEKFSHIKSTIDLKMISGYVGYLVLGHLLGNIKITRTPFFISILVFILTVALTSVATYIFTLRNKGIFVADFYDYLSPNVVLMSASAFVIIKYMFEHTKVQEFSLSNKLIKTLSSASLGIYLIHLMVLFVLQKGDLGFVLSPFSFNAVYSIPVTTIITFSISFSIIYFIQKVPILRRIAP